jgi:hypothetical protein
MPRRRSESASWLPLAVPCVVGHLHARLHKLSGEPCPLCGSTVDSPRLIPESAKPPVTSLDLEQIPF